MSLRARARLVGVVAACGGAMVDLGWSRSCYGVGGGGWGVIWRGRAAVTGGVEVATLTRRGRVGRRSSGMSGGFGSLTLAARGLGEELRSSTRGGDAAGSEAVMRCTGRRRSRAGVSEDKAAGGGAGGLNGRRSRGHEMEELGWAALEARAEDGGGLGVVGGEALAGGVDRHSSGLKRGSRRRRSRVAGTLAELGRRLDLVEGASGGWRGSQLGEGTRER